MFTVLWLFEVRANTPNNTYQKNSYKSGHTVVVKTVTKFQTEETKLFIKYFSTVAMEDHYDNIIEHNGFYFSNGHLISHELQYSGSILKIWRPKLRISYYSWPEETSLHPLIGYQR